MGGGMPAAAKYHTYVIDREYRIVYLDQEARRVFPGGRVGALCHESFRNMPEPCADCPWKMGKDRHIVQSAIYNAPLDCWYEVACLELDWFDQGPCVLFSSHPVDERSRNLFATLSEPSSYDELFEINLSGNSYKVLYTEPGKYVMPPLEGALSTMFQDVLENMIGPGDRERFRAFWDFDTLTERIEAAGGSLHGEFRKRLCAGGWGWASQTVIPVKRGHGGETVLMCFIADIDEEVRARRESVEKAQILLLKERDQLTGLFNAATFYERAEQLVTDFPEQRFEVAYVDIAHFKVFNEWHGREAGDAILRAIAERLELIARRHKGVAGYLGGDDFAVVVPAGTTTANGVDREMQLPPFDDESTIGFQPVMGVCAIDGPGSVITACDHAMLAMNSIKGNYSKRIAWYRAAMAEELEGETKVLLDIKRALKDRELVIYWQPQCSTRTGLIVGLEALVRWQHPERGLVMPGAFIPVLERNGFIASLDLYVWDEVCRHIRAWIDRGRRPLPVSVNISRADLYAVDVVETLEELVGRYRLDRSLLELEITESAYVEDGKMAETAKQLKELGFTILMDDFGSGYSSLNMLKDIAVDVLKIDMGFLHQEDDTNRSESILETIVSMARLMDLRVIAEGAETREQVEFLQDVGCDYAQGYYFHRPMDTESLERLIADESAVDFRGVLSPEVEIVDMDALLQGDELSRSIVDNLIGGMAVYAVCDGRFELLQVNNEYYRTTGCNPVDLRERQNVIWKQVHPDDLDAVISLFDMAEQHPVSGAEGTFRRYRLNGDLMWLKLRAFFLSRQEDRRIFYASVEDVTERRMQELASLGAVSSEGRLFELLNAQAAHHWCINLTRRSFLSERDRELFERHLGLSFQDWQDYNADEAIFAVVRSNSEQDALDAFLSQESMLDYYAQGVSSRKMEYRQAPGCFDPLSAAGFVKVPEHAEEERWAELCYHLISFEDCDDVYAYLYVVDIDDRKQREIDLAVRAEHDALTGLLNRQTATSRIYDAFASTVSTGLSGAFAIIDLDDFKRINDRYGHLCGDKVLSGIGKHLRSAFRKQDLICRWGGDEFVVYCDDASVEDMARRIGDLCCNRWSTDVAPGKTIRLSLSAGIAMVPQHGTQFTAVYERADAALYQAKADGKAQFRIYEAGMQPHIAPGE